MMVRPRWDRGSYISSTSRLSRKTARGPVRSNWFSFSGMDSRMSIQIAPAGHLNIQGWNSPMLSLSRMVA